MSSGNCGRCATKRIGSCFRSTFQFRKKHSEPSGASLAKGTNFWKSEPPWAGQSCEGDRHGEQVVRLAMEPLQKHCVSIILIGISVGENILLLITDVCYSDKQSIRSYSLERKEMKRTTKAPVHLLCVDLEQTHSQTKNQAWNVRHSNHSKHMFVT